MFFEDLKENYTKVSYKSVMTQKSIEQEIKINPIPKKNNIYKVVVVAGAILLVLFDPTAAFANGLIETKARELYFGQFLGIAKWIIILKGGWDAINSTLKGDFDGAKKTFVQYLVVFCTLLGLPAALDFVEGLFRDA